MTFSIRDADGTFPEQLQDYSDTHGAEAQELFSDLHFAIDAFFLFLFRD
jgi:hypothetical protein